MTTLKTVDYLKNLRVELYQLQELANQAFLSFVNSTHEIKFEAWRTQIQNEIESITMAITYNTNVVEMWGEPPNWPLIRRYFKVLNALRTLPIAKMAKLAVKRNLGSAQHFRQNFVDLTQDYNTPRQRSIMHSFTDAHGISHNYAYDDDVSDIDHDDFNF
ncbi:MAG: hypothetical protein ACO28V_07840 [Chitinophagaceae bacterium]